MIPSTYHYGLDGPLEINELRTVTKEVVETAREQLVIGPL